MSFACPTRLLGRRLSCVNVTQSSGLFIPRTGRGRFLGTVFAWLGQLSHDGSEKRSQAACELPLLLAPNGVPSPFKDHLACMCLRRTSRTSLPSGHFPSAPSRCPREASTFACGRPIARR